MITLKAARVNKNLKQRDACKALGISLATLCKYEKGRTFPDVPTIKKMEKLYDINYNDIDFFVAEEND